MSDMILSLDIEDLPAINDKLETVLELQDHLAEPIIEGKEFDE
jgi:hypothetical protein